MSQESYKFICYILLALLAYSVFSHYNTGKNYTATCNQLLFILNEDESRIEQVLGKRLGSECLNRMSSD